jgi:hypothetical protein
MQDQIRDSLLIHKGIAYDSINSTQPVFIETRPSAQSSSIENLYSTDLSKTSIPDWYFLIILLIIAGIAWARIVYGKFLYSIWFSSYSYQNASKVYKEQSVVQKRFGVGLDFLYLVNASLFIYQLNRFFSPVIFKSDDIVFVLQVFLVLCFLVFVRIFVMRLTAYIFERSELFLEFLYHFFIFNKVLGMVLIPFLIAIPYTQGKLQEILIYTGISIVFTIQFFRLFRVAVYVLKNVVLFFYLILYLCILEILPVLVVIKLLLFLAQV